MCRADVFPLKVTVRAGQTKSDPADLKGHQIVGVITPASITGTTISFEGEVGRNGNFVPIHDDGGTAISWTIAASRMTLALNLAKRVVGPDRVKVVVAAQAADTTFTLLLAPTLDR